MARAWCWKTGRVAAVAVHPFERPIACLQRSALLAAVFCCGCFAAGPAASHDFWLQPDGFFKAAGVAASFTLQVGHGPDRQRSQIPLRRIIRFAHFMPSDERVDLRSQLRAEGERIQLQIPGLHVLVLETDNGAQSHLPALRFNEYLRAEGLVPALKHRADRDLMGADGSERYRRVAKSMIQVGPPGEGPQFQATRALGLQLEIVLDQSPYTDPRSATLPVRIIYEGKPLAGALVKLTDLAHDELPLETQLSDAAGRANFAMPGNGDWMLNVIWTKPVTHSEGIDFETVFSSLSFGLAE